MSSSSGRNQSCQCQPLISNIFSPWSEECLTHPFPKHSQTPRTPISQCPKAILTAQTSTGFFLKSGSLFWKSQRFLLKKKEQFERQLANSPSLQPGHCSWVTTNWAPEQILSFIFKKRTSSRLSRTGCFNSIKLCSKRNVCATGMTHPTWKGLHHQPHLPQEKKILRNVPSD